MKLTVSVLVCLALAGAAFAQGPDFSGLPATANNKDLAALVDQLVKRVAELERRVDALEASQARTLTAEGEVKADPEAARLLAAAMAEKEKLARRLDGFSREDPKDPRIQASRVRSTESWDAVVGDAKRFGEALRAAVGHPPAAGDPGRSSLEGLIKWGRGRSVFQVRRILDAKEQLILPLDFGTEIVPHDTK